MNKLLKAHFDFGTTYNTILHKMYTFIQTTVYNKDVGKVKVLVLLRLEQGCLARWFNGFCTEYSDVLSFHADVIHFCA